MIEEKEVMMRALEDQALRAATAPVTRSEMLELLEHLSIHSAGALSVWSLERKLRQRWGVPK